MFVCVCVCVSEQPNRTTKQERGYVMEQLKKRLATLLSVKSIVTLVLTFVFAYMAITSRISQDFMTVYAVVIAFYFGTQSQKVQDVVDKAGES